MVLDGLLIIIIITFQLNSRWPTTVGFWGTGLWLTCYTVTVGLLPGHLPGHASSVACLSLGLQICSAAGLQNCFVTSASPTADLLNYPLSGDWTPPKKSDGFSDPGRKFNRLLKKNLPRKPSVQNGAVKVVTWTRKTIFLCCWLLFIGSLFLYWFRKCLHCYISHYY